MQRTTKTFIGGIILGIILGMFIQSFITINFLLI